MAAMSRSTADLPTLFEGDERRNGENCVGAVDYVAVNGLCPDNRESWTCVDRIFWLDEWLVQSNPKVRLLHVTNGISHMSRWEELLREGENLLREVDRYRRDDSNVPLIFLCYGLGGIMFLKLSGSRQAQKRLDLTTAGVVFFGTPLTVQKTNDIKKALRNCATVELRLEQIEMALPDDDVTKEIVDLLKGVEYGNFSILTTFEKLESSYGNRRRTLSSAPRKKVLVPESLARVKSTESLGCIGFESDHLSIAKLDRSSFNLIISRLQSIIGKAHSNTVTNIAYLDWLTKCIAHLESGLPMASSPIQVATGSVPLTYSDRLHGGLVPSEAIRQLDIGSIGQEFASIEVSSSSHRPLDRALSQETHVVPEFSRSGQRMDAKLPCHEITFGQNPKFFGRADTLQKVEDALLGTRLPGNNKHRAFAISGTAGIGKTQTALHFTYQHREDFQSILWASAETENKLLQSFAAYALALGIISEPSEFGIDAQKLMRWYEKTDVRWLLIFDNAVDVNLVLNFWPRLGQSGSILITTQDPFFAKPDIAGAGQELPQLDEESAIALVQDSVPRPMRTVRGIQDAREIVQRVGCLPVAIRTCIGQITEADCSLSEYIEKWNTQEIISESNIKHVNTVHAPYNKSLNDLWATSFKSLNPKARCMMDILSLIDVENIPEGLFRPLHDETLTSKLPFLRDRVKCIRDLVGSSLISKDKEIEANVDRHFHIHRMTRAFAQMQMDTEAQQIAFDSATLLLEDKVWIGAREERIAQFKQYFEHVQALFGLVSQLPSSAQESPHGNKPRLSVTFISLIRKMAWLCYGQRFFGPGLLFIKLAQDIYNSPRRRLEVSGEQSKLDVELVWIYYYHGCFLTVTGNPRDLVESKESFETALKYHKECREAGHNRLHILPKLCALKDGLGNALNGLGRQVEAEEAYLEALELTPEDVLFSVSESNLCRCLLFQGPARLQEASDRLEKVIARRIAILGDDDNETFISGGPGNNYNVLGNIRIAQAQDILSSPEQRRKQLDEAYQLHLKALRSWSKIFGEDHHETADVSHKLAWHLAERRNYPAAIQYLERALAIYGSPVNRDHRKGEMARTNYKLSLVLTAYGDYDKASERKKTAEELRKEILKHNSVTWRPATGEESYNKLVNIWTL